MHTQTLLDALTKRGLRARAVSVRHLPELREAIEGRRRAGLLDEAIHRLYLERFRYSVPEGFPEARSLVVLAKPEPPVRLRFAHPGGTISTILPPTYLYRAPDETMREALVGVLGPLGYRIEDAKVPLKHLAVCSGLARYGRNNITYVPGFGSYHRLQAFFSDLPCDDDAWEEPRALEACTRCTACVRPCPTGAITTDRFAIYAERCLAFLNEQPGEMDGIEPSVHHTLVGCMRCQQACPENRGLLSEDAPGPEFSEAETTLLLGGPEPEALPAETAAKLASVDWAEADLPVLARNLGLLLAQERG